VKQTSRRQQQQLNAATPISATEQIGNKFTIISATINTGLIGAAPLSIETRNIVLV